MSRDLSEIEFRNKLFGDAKWPSDMDELVSGWISYQQIATEPDVTSGDDRLQNEFFWAYQCAEDLYLDHPHLGLDFIVEVLAKNPPAEVLGVLAAGPLEELLAWHGPAVIDRAESEAHRDPKFRRLLGGVWQNAMTDDIWERVQRLAPEKW